MSLLPAIYTVESVTKGHPDRVCDRLVDEILKNITEQDPTARVAVEAFGCKGVLTIGGEVSTSARVEYSAIAREVLQQVGYDDPLDIRVHITEQSPEISQAVSAGGAGDQGIMYGYATNETESFLPLGVHLARSLTSELERLRESGELPWLRSDGKAQVTIENGAPGTILISTQHDPSISLEELRQQIQEKIISPLTPQRILINPAGAWHTGGFSADSGLTGRKLAVDGYGGILPGGGGSTHGKDHTKVDCSATAEARRAAIELVKSGQVSECLISVAYAIGVNEPVMLHALNEDGKDITSLLNQERFFAAHLAP